MKCLQCVEENGCSDDYKIIHYSHLRYHNMSLVEYKKKFNIEKTFDPEYQSEDRRKQRSETQKRI